MTYTSVYSKKIKITDIAVKKDVIVVSYEDGKIVFYVRENSEEPYKTYKPK